MRAILDTNVYISYLLKPSPDRTPGRIMEHAALRHFQFCVCGDLLSDLARTVASKPSLTTRIDAANLEAFVTRLRRESDFIDELPLATPGVVRDSKDDFLIAHALVANADYLVTGDNDLLALERVGGVDIVSPAEFVFLIEMDDE